MTPNTKLALLPSSELWQDGDATVVADRPEPLDLVLFNATEDPWGAHLGVCMAPDEVFHLCKEVGTPVVWPMAEFSRRSRYATTVGLKRVVTTVGADPPAGSSASNSSLPAGLNSEMWDSEPQPRTGAPGK